MRFAAVVGIFGWLTVYFAKVCSSVSYFLASSADCHFVAVILAFL
jgi:hypothetical protein